MRSALERCGKLLELECYSLKPRLDRTATCQVRVPLKNSGGGWRADEVSVREVNEQARSA